MVEVNAPRDRYKFGKKIIALVEFCRLFLKKIQDFAAIHSFHGQFEFCRALLSRFGLVTHGGFSQHIVTENNH